MTSRHRAAGWALLTLNIVLASCESIPPVSHRYRIHGDRSAEKRDLSKYLPYRLASNELAARVRGVPRAETVNRAFAIFDLTAYLSLLGNEGFGGIQGVQGSCSVTAEGPATIDPGSQESRADSAQGCGKALVVEGTGRFESQVEFEDHVGDRAAYLRGHNATIAEIIERDQVMRMIFQHSTERLSRLIEETTRSRGDLLQLRKSRSVDEIVPGETFEYTLEARNIARATLRNIVLYDQLPASLHFERSFRATLGRADGSEVSFDEKTHPVFFQSALTDDEWERGKICWIVATEFRHGDRLKLSFDATWYRSRGGPSTDGVPLYAGQTASEDEVVTKLGARDHVFLIEPREENEDFLQVFVRRPVETAAEKGNKVTRFEKLHGFLLAEHYRQQIEADAMKRRSHAP